MRHPLCILSRWTCVAAGLFFAICASGCAGSANPDAERLKTAVCQKFADCAPSSTTCCWKADKPTTPETTALVDRCLADLDAEGCNWQEVLSCGDPPITCVRPVSEACHAAAEALGFEANGSPLLG